MRLGLYGVSFEVGADGVATSGTATFAGIERFDVKLYRGDNHLLTGDGADIIVNATKPRNVGDNLIDAGGGDDNVNLYNGGIQQVEGGVGYDRLVFRTNHVVTFNDVDGSFSDGARETGFEKASIVVGGGSTLLLSTGADLTVAAARGHVVIDRGATADGVAYSLNSSSGFFSRPI